MPEALKAKLAAKLAELRAKRAFNAAEWSDKKTDMFNDYMRRCGLKACVVSLSGGVDSAVTLALMKQAASKPGSPIQRVLAIAQPIHSSGWASERAHETAKALGCEIITVDQTEIHDQLRVLIDKAVGIEGKPFATGQLRSYQRTPVGYYVAQLLSQEGFPCVVMGTGNKDEDGYLAYFCKAGDGVVDVQLIADIHKSEVFAVGKHLGVPASTLEAAPSADLWDGQTDEDELGFPYDFIELWMQYIEMSEEQRILFRRDLDTESLQQLEEWGTSAARVHNRNAHKIDSPHNINIL